MMEFWQRLDSSQLIGEETVPKRLMYLPQEVGHDDENTN